MNLGSVAIFDSNNSLTFVPSFDDFADFRATHDSYLEMPLKSGPWKIRIGISNDFRSEPPSNWTKWTPLGIPGWCSVGTKADRSG